MNNIGGKVLNNKTQKIMDFPSDIWEVIMSYFHSSYKKPSHYEAIMDTHEFYFIRKHHRESIKHNLKWNKHLYVDSYYMRLILNANYNTTTKNKGKMKRKKASPAIRDDFVEIFETYKNNCATNILKNLKY